MDSVNTRKRNVVFYYQFIQNSDYIILSLSETAAN